MLPDKITKNFKEISKIFVENFEKSANAIFTVLDMLNLNDKSLCLSINYNAKYSQILKECKQHLLLNNCQSVDFDVQIAEITFSFIRFNILSTILRKQNSIIENQLVKKFNKVGMI